MTSQEPDSPAKSVEGTAHTDDLAVDRFAAAMKAKLAKKRAQGYSGWDNPEECPIIQLERLLEQHFYKGDFIDIANFCMMLHQRGRTIRVGCIPTFASNDKVRAIERRLSLVDLRYSASNLATPIERRLDNQPNAGD